MTDWMLPEGMPTLKHLQRTIEQLEEILAKRGLEPDVDYVDTHYEMNGLATALMQRGLVTAEEIEYYAAVVRLKSLERHERASRPKPRIYVPGRDGPLS